jgi:hypothetical protein
MIIFFPGRETAPRENHLPLRGNGVLNWSKADYLTYVS